MGHKLKPCPWCGGKAKIKTVVKERHGYHCAQVAAVCEGCGTSRGSFRVEDYDWEKKERLYIEKEAMKAAADAWNTRAPAEALQE